MAGSLHQWPAQGCVYHRTSLVEALPREIADAARIVLVTTRSLANGALVAAAKAAIGERLAGFSPPCARIARSRTFSPWQG